MAIGFINSPTVVKIAVICVILGTVLQIVGFASPFWTAGAIAHEGLWQQCPYDTILNQKKCESYPEIEGWFQSVRTLEAFGLIGALVSMILSILNICVTKTHGTLIIAILSSVVTCCTAIFILAGVFTFLQHTIARDYISWAFGLSALGGSLFGVAAVFFIVSMCVVCIHKSKKKKEKPYVV